MKKIHLICNAHLDPIWQWTWDEGVSAVISTFKSAVDLAKDYDYVFCHGESLLYEVIEKNAPELFKQIQELVKIGKWHISGGWYLQPDCLMPNGETFIRHIKIGREYFEEKFNKIPTVATNYDSFGHSLGLVQIMKKTGFNGYMVCRPRNFVYPSIYFKWQAPDGSSISVANVGTYNSALGKATEKIKSIALSGISTGMLGAEETTKNENADDVLCITWGVGNHGGGPSRKDLQDIKDLKIDGFEIIHSTPENFFSDNINTPGEITTSLVPSMPGCYSSMARVKQSFRHTENMFYATEKMLAVAKANGLDFDDTELKDAEKKLLLASFHDILPGTCIEEGEKEGLSLLSACEKTLREYRTQAFLYLTINQQKAGEGEYPVFVFNYLPSEIKTPIEVEFSLADQNWDENSCFVPYVYDESGNLLISQQVKEDSTLNLDWRKKIVFEGILKPLGVTRFTIKTKLENATKKQAEAIEIDKLLKDNSLLNEPIIIESYDDTADPWGMSKEELVSMGKNPKEFKLMSAKKSREYCAVDNDLSPTRIIENGNVYKEVECLYTLDNSNAVLRYKLYKNQPYIDVKAIVEFADKNKLLRLKIKLPKEFENAKTVGDGPYVWEEKITSEVPFQKWLGKENEKGEIFAVINDGVYAGKSENGYLYLTLVRGAGYCFHPIGKRPLYPQDRYLNRIDVGRYTYNIRIFKGSVIDTFKQAEQLNNLPYAMNFFPVGETNKDLKGVKVDGNVTLTAIIPNKNGKYLFRLYNPSNNSEEFSLGFGNDTTSGVALKHGIVTVEYQNGNFTIYNDKIIY